jgi:6-phosphogluconolactonase (cycloisomerase 2 family)
MHVSSIAVTALGLVPSAAFAADLFVSHFSGTVYSLSYTSGNNGNGSLALKSSASGCGRMPSWLTFDSPSKSLYCFDETGSWGGGSVVASFAVNTDGSLKSSGQAKSTGGEVHGSLYGGVNGTSFVAMAE